MNEMNCKNQCVCGELLGVEMVKGKSGRRAFWQVKCTKCGRETAKYTKPEGALMAWNRRRVSGKAVTMADVLRNETAFEETDRILEQMQQNAETERKLEQMQQNAQNQPALNHSERHEVQVPDMRA